MSIYLARRSAGRHESQVREPVYPTVSRDGMPFPINKSIQDIQRRAFKEEHAWRGNIVVAKYRENPFSSMVNASMSDFPILKNYFLTHGAPRQVRNQITSLVQYASEWILQGIGP